MTGIMQLNGPPVILYNTGQLQDISKNGLTGFVAALDTAISEKQKADKKKNEVYKDRYGQIIRIIASNESAKISHEKPDDPPAFTKPKGGRKKESGLKPDYQELIEQGAIDFRV